MSWRNQSWFLFKVGYKIISGDGGSQSHANKSVMEVRWCANCPYDRFPSSGCLSCHRRRAVTGPAVQFMDTSEIVLRSGCVTEDRVERETCFHLRAKWRGPAAAGSATGESREEALRLIHLFSTAPTKDLDLFMWWSYKYCKCFRICCGSMIWPG